MVVQGQMTNNILVTNQSLEPSLDFIRDVLSLRLIPLEPVGVVEGVGFRFVDGFRAFLGL